MENTDLEYPNMLKFVLAREGGYVNRKTDRGLRLDQLTDSQINELLDELI